MFLRTAINASLIAGEKILEVYNSEFAVEHKDDKSPLTEADKQSHNAIVNALKGIDIPILSEEGKSIEYDERKNWELFWMIDPLDGTKEFIKRNGEFTVNIALIKNSAPILGVIYVPVTKELYFGDINKGSFKVNNFTKTINSLDEILNISNKLPEENKSNKYVVVGSRSHMSEETLEYINTEAAKHGDVEILSKGSSLKLCMVAEGKANAYPRFAPTMEWDTAAGQAIVEASGAEVLNWKTKKSMAYNKENLLNDWFLVIR